MKYVVTYDYLSGADFGFHTDRVVTEDVKGVIIKLLDADFGAKRWTCGNPLQVNAIRWDECQ